MDLTPFSEKKDIILKFHSQEYPVYGSKLMQISPLFKTFIVKFSKTLIPILRDYSDEIFRKFVNYVNGEETHLESSEIPEFFQLCKDYKCDVIVENIKRKLAIQEIDNEHIIPPQAILDSLLVSLVSNQNTSEIENNIAQNLSNFVDLPSFASIPIHVLMRIFFNGGYKSDPQTLTKFFSISFSIDKPSTIYMLQFIDMDKQNWENEECSKFSKQIVDSQFPVLSSFMSKTIQHNHLLEEEVQTQTNVIQTLTQEKENLNRTVRELNERIGNLEQTCNNFNNIINNNANETAAQGYDIFDSIDHNDQNKIDAILKYKSTHEKFKEVKRLEFNGVLYSLNPLHYAILLKKIEIIKTFFTILGLNGAFQDEILNSNMPTNDGYTPLYFCILSDSDESIIKILLENDADINFVDSRFNHNSPLLEAVEKGKTAIAKCFLTFYKDHNKKHEHIQYKVLFKAIEKRLDIIDLIIETHKDEDIPLLVNSKDENELSPLHIALQYGNYKAVKTLLKYDADIKYQTKNGYYPIHLAATKIDSGILKLILEHIKTKAKDNINEVDAVGNTPLILAVKYSLIKNVKLLLDNNADKTIKNFLDQDAKVYATNEEIKGLLN